MVRLLLFALTATALLAREPDPAAAPVSAFRDGQGVDGEVSAIAFQPDGRIVVGGQFTSIDGVPRQGIARLNADGTLDRTFADQVELGVNGQVLALAVQADGGIVAGGVFTQAAGQAIMNLCRYKPDGTLDASFGGEQHAAGANGSVLAIAIQPDGKIVIGGNFSSVFGQVRRGIARLNPDGSLADGPTAASALTGTVSALAAGPSVVAGGSFEVAGQTGRGLFRAPLP